MIKTLLILFFLSSECPISRYYAPEIRRICADYRSKGVTCALIFEDCSLSTDDVRRHLEEFGYHDIPALIDATGGIAQMAGASVTPQAVVIDTAAKVRYRGRIDDFYFDLGKPRRQVTVHDLTDALEALINGKPVTYDDVKKRGRLIAAVTKSRYMPPWHAAHGYGEFRDERRLTDREIAAIGEWVSEGMPQGDPSKMPALPSFPEGWHLGRPDLILEMPLGYDVPANGPDIYRNFALSTGLSEDKWVRAVEFRPSARKVVHHALFAYDSSGAVRKLEGADGHAGSASGMAPLGVASPASSGPLGGWAVGATASFLPEGTALRLPKGSDFVLQVHFHPSGKLEMERSVVGIYFADRAPEKDLIAVQIPSLFGFGAGINIPAGRSDLMMPVRNEEGTHPSGCVILADGKHPGGNRRTEHG